VPNELSNLSEYESSDPEKINEIFFIDTDKDIDDIKNNALTYVKKINNLSYSNIASYRRCPMQFVYQAIYKIPSEPKPYFKFGQFIHRMLEELHKHLKQNQVLTEEAFIKMYNDRWNLSTVGFDNEEHKEDYKKEGERILRDYYNTNKNSWKESLYLEKRFSFSTANNIKINGVIDRIDKLNEEGDCEIIDYKTGRPKDLKQFNKDKENALQLYIYAIACQDKLNINATKLTFYYLTDGSKIQIEPEPEDLSYAQDVIDETSENIKAGSFDATPSAFKCKSCEFRRICKFSASKV
jgi:DNA helicase-2/ATP-dependent DNA helicase PcrA